MHLFYLTIERNVMQVKELREILEQYADDVEVEIYLPSQDYWHSSEQKDIAEVVYDGTESYYKTLVLYPT